MRRLGEDFDQIANQLIALKQAVAERSTPVRQLLDFSALNSDNLEALDAIDPEAPYLQVRSIPHCGVCDEGFARIEGTHNHVKMCDRCERPRRKAKRLNQLKLPLDSVGMSLSRYRFDSPLQEQRVKQLLSHMTQPQGLSPSLFIWGQPGNGKTSLLYSLARWSCFAGATGLRVKFTSHTDLINAIKRTFGGERRDPLERWLDNTDVLLLDELGGVGGSAKRTDWYAAITAEIVAKIYERWRAGKLTVVITTNLTPRRVAALFDHNAAVLSRLNSIFGSPLELKGPDQRGNLEALKGWGLT